MNATATFGLAVVLDAINRTGGAFRSVEADVNKIKSSFGKAGDSFSKLISVQSAIPVSLGLVFAKQGMEMEKTQMRFEVFLKSADKAKTMVAALNDFAKETLYSGNETFSAATPLLNHYKEADVVREKLMMLSDVAQGLGSITLQELSQKFSIFRAQQTLFTQDIKEMTNRGFDLNYFADALGTTSDKVFEFASEGKVKFKDFEKALQLATQEGGSFYKMTEKISDSTGGRLDAAMGEFQQHLTTLSIHSLPLLSDLVKGALVPLAQFTGAFVAAHPVIAKVASWGILFGAAALPLLRLGQSIWFFGSGVASAIVGAVKFTQTVVALRSAMVTGDIIKYYSTIGNASPMAIRLARALRLVTIQQLGLNAAMSANVAAIAFVAILAAATAGIAYMTYQTNKAKEAMRLQNDVNEATIEQAAQKRAGMQEEIDNLANLKEGTAEYNLAVNRLKNNYGEYVKYINWSKVSKKDLPELSKKIAEGIELEAKALALARIKSEQYYEAEKARMEAASIKNNWADDAMMQTFAGGLLTKFFGNTQKRNEAAERYATGRENIAAINEMQQSNNAEIRLTTNVVLDGKVVGSTVNNVNRIDNRGNYE